MDNVSSGSGSIGGEPSLFSTTTPFQSGLRLLEMNCFEEAIKAFNQAIEQHPNVLRFYYYRSRAHYEAQNYEEALEDLQVALSRKVSMQRSLYHYGLALYSDILETEDKETLEEFRQVTPGMDLKSYAFFNRGLSYYYAKLPLKAIEAFTSMIRRLSNHAMGYFYRGLSSYMNKNFKLAVNDLERSTELEPSYTSFYNLGLSQLNLGDFEGAIKSFTECIRLDTKDKSSYNNRGMAYRAQGHYALAIADFSVAISLDVHYVQAIFNRARCSIDMKDYSRSIDDLTMCLELSNSEQYYYYRAISYNNIHRCQEAIKDLKLAISMNPKDPNLYDALGDIHLSNKEYELAENNFTKTIELDPLHHEALRKRGIARNRQQKASHLIVDDIWKSYLLSPYSKVIRDRLKYVSLCAI